MIRRLLLLLICGMLHAFSAGGQGGVWTWMGGGPSTTGNYGVKGVAAASNEPPPRYQACYWTDRDGNFWLFGGVMNVVSGFGNDLWKYDVRTNLWTWVSGPNCLSAPNPAGVPGTRGIPSANNVPSARGYGANCWTDNRGDLWLYGGIGGFNDLWKYSIASNQWTWVHGTQTTTAPIFGTMGIAAAANTPGSVQEVKSAWVDAANNLWMFGTNGCNTMWKYDISANQWTWVNGATAPTAGNYGTFGVEATTNQPPPRWSYTRWKDSADNMYLFAGYGANNYYNDVWRYRPSTNSWTWIAGTNGTKDSGRFPPQYCTFYDNYYPPCRYENQTAFSINACSKAFWTFGGWSSSNGFLNDLWLFNTVTAKWAWISGSGALNPSGNYGSAGVPSASNMPPGKSGQCMWTDNAQNLWLFGGFSPGSTLNNDLWRFVPDTLCIDKAALFAAWDRPTLNDSVICPGDTATIRIGRHTSLHYTPDAFVKPNKDSSLLKLSPPVTTAYTIVSRGGHCGGGTDSVQFTITVLATDTVRLAPPVPRVICRGDTAKMAVKPGWKIRVSPATDVSYQLTGGTEIRFFPAVTTTYAVVAESSAPCSDGPDSISFTIITDTTDITAFSPMADTALCQYDTAIYHLNTKWEALRLYPPVHFSLNSDSTLFTFWPPVTTTYRLAGTRTSSCRSLSDTISFTIHRSGLDAAFVVTPKETDQRHPRFQLVNTTQRGSRYDWYRDGAFISSDHSPAVKVDDTGRYCFTLIARDQLGCVDTAIDCGQVVHAQIYVPSAFSPNGDARNDGFRPLTHNVKIESFFVYNRYGERVFAGYSADDAWDGRYRGRPCDLGTYFYYIRYRILNQEPVLIKGDVTLIR